MKQKLLFTLMIVVLLTAACAKQITGNEVVAAFKAAGLEAENSYTMTKDDYNISPYVCTGTRFFIPSIGADNGGRVFVCDTAEDRDLIANYYTELGKSSALFFSWVFIKDNVVVQINGDLPEETARKYEAALP